MDFVDVNSISDDKSNKWFPNISFTGSVGQLFAKGALGAGLTLGVQTNSPRAFNNGPAGIYAIGGVDNALFAGNTGLANIEHELSHYVSGITDFGIVNAFKIPIPKDKNTGQPISDSEAVQLWFQNGCK